MTDNTIKFIIGDLDSQEELTVYFIARFRAASELPVGTTCLTNVARAYSDEDNLSDTDYASFCVVKDGTEIITEVTPDTGFDLTTILVIQALALAGLGIFALNKSKRITK